jgi:hypothetical protein
MPVSAAPSPPPATSTQKAYEGCAFVYHGTEDGLQSEASWTAQGGQAYASFGGSVATAGDVNGDGFADVIVGAHSFGDWHEGRAYVYHGSAQGLHPGPDWSAGGDQPYAYFGASVSSAGNINQDSFADVVVGAHGWGEGRTLDGQAYLYQGQDSSQ